MRVQVVVVMAAKPESLNKKSGEIQRALPARAAIELRKRVDRSSPVTVGFTRYYELSEEAAKVVSAPGFYDVDFLFDERQDVKGYDGRDYVAGTTAVMGILSAKRLPS